MRLRPGPEQHPLKSNRAIQVSFGQDGSLDIEVIPVGTSDAGS